LEYTDAKVKDIFVEFLKGFKDAKNELRYRTAISALPGENRKSIVVDYPDLLSYNTDLATSLLRQPELFLRAFDLAALETLAIENPVYADKIKKELHVRIRELTDRISLRGVTKENLNMLILVAGMVTRTSELRPLAVTAAFRCSSGHVTRVEQSGMILKKPVKCEEEGCGETKNFELDDTETEFIDFQVIRIQEMPEELPPGQLPQSFDVHLTGDIVNSARPGDRIILTGIVKAESDYAGASTRLRLFNNRIEANYVEQLGKRPEDIEIDREEEEKIKAIAAAPGAYDRLINSVAPAIFGHELHKEAALLLMVGSPQKHLPDGSTLRGDISVLIVGDPGTAKSELLKYVARIAPRGLYTSGRGSTAAGLTAAVVKEKNGMMMLEAGATVLADLGIACLHPSSSVIFNNKVSTVEELSRNIAFVPAVSSGEICELGELKGLVPSFNIGEIRAETNSSSFLRRKKYSGKMLEIKLRSGFTLCVTPDHKLLDGNSLVWKEASRFSKQDYLVAPLLLPEASAPARIYLWDILPDETKVSLSQVEKSSLRPLLESKYCTLANASHIIGVERLPEYYRQRSQPTLAELKLIVRALGIEESWRTTPHVYDKSEILISELTPELAYICGFIFGDGWVKVSDRHAQITMRQSSVHLTQIRQLETYWKKVFKIPFHIGTPREETSVIRGNKVVSNSYNWHMGRRVLANVYEYLSRDDLAYLVGLPKNVLAAFISGLVDSDGCFSKKTCTIGGKKYHTWNLTFTISSKDRANLNLLLAMRRFDCLGSYRGKKNGVGIVTISGRRDCELLQHELSPYSLKMKSAPAQRLHNVSGLSEKLPAIPVRDSLKRILENTNRSELVRSGIWPVVYEYSRMKRQPASSQVLKILSKGLELPMEERSVLTKLANRDYFLDEIQDICEVPYEGQVYDLVIGGENHNFVADGVFVHNCIDEFDKMRDEDRSALHEVMEQQSASIAKGGIIATLNARTSIFAAANPMDGKYDPFKNILDNVQLPIPLLTRFDLIFIIRDEPDPAKDENVAKHILDMRAKSAFPVTPSIDFELLKKYVIYAKKLDPELTEEARSRLSGFYIKMRREAAPDQLSVTPRWLEGLIRLSIARARVLLHTRVTEEDALHAIRLIERMLQTVAVDQATKKVDIGVLYNKPISEKGLRETALEVFKKLSGESKQPVEDKAFYEEMEKTGKFTREQAEKVFQDMWKSGVIYESKPHFFKKA